MNVVYVRICTYTRQLLTQCSISSHITHLFLLELYLGVTSVPSMIICGMVLIQKCRIVVALKKVHFHRQISSSYSSCCVSLVVSLCVLDRNCRKPILMRSCEKLRLPFSDTGKKCEMHLFIDLFVNPRLFYMLLT